MDLDMFDFSHNAQVGNNAVDIEVGDDVPAKATPDIPVDVVDVEDDGRRLNPRKRKPPPVPKPKRPEAECWDHFDKVKEGKRTKFGICKNRINNMLQIPKFMELVV